MTPAQLLRRAILVLFALVAIAACEDPAPPATARGVSARGPSTGPPMVSPSLLPPAPGAARTDPRSARERRMAAPPPLPAAPGAGAPSAGSPEPLGPPIEDRLREGLQRAFGTPTQCIAQDTRARLRDRLTIQVQVTVTSAGRVTRASVSSSQLGRADLECMRRHAETLRLATDVPNAPRSVTASVEYEVTPEGAIETRRELPEVAPVPGRVGPDRTLPGAGTVTDRPAGSVVPDSTLPAGGTATDRPPGSVAPSFTLPAVAE